MNSAVAKAAAILNSQVNASMHLRAALFHSTPVLDRRKRDYHESRRRYYVRRDRRKQKEDLHRNATSYAEHLFKKLEREFDDSDPLSSGYSSRFRRQHNKGPRRGQTSNQGSQCRGRREYQFCEESDSDFETIFRYAFGGDRQARHCFWSFIQDEDSHWSSSFRYSYNFGRSSNRKYRYTEYSEPDSSTEHEHEHKHSKSDRVILGLSPSGPLLMKDVKDAYRACAMKWHPDRHQGSSKTDAEEKFKLCSAAYESLREKLELSQ